MFGTTSFLFFLLIMSRKGTSLKMTFSAEATSPDPNKTVGMMSDRDTSSKKPCFDGPALVKDLKSADSVLYLDELHVGLTGTIVVMLCRIWDVSAVNGRYLSTDMVVSDARGNCIHCTARSNVAHNFVRLKEGVVYRIKNFVVHQNKAEYCVRKDDAFMLELNGATSARKSLAKGADFLRYPFQLVDLDRVELTANKYMIDVAGYVTNVGRSIQQRTGSRTLDFYVANERGHMLRVTLWGALGDILIEKKTKYVGQCAIVLTAMNVKTYNNKLYLSSSSSSQIFDDPDIPILKELRSHESVVEPSMEIMTVELGEPREGTLENLLLWARNRRNDPVSFICQVRIDNIMKRNGWNQATCGGEKCKKGLSRKLGGWWCDSCDKAINYPVLRYRLELGISDATSHAVVVMFDETASELVRCPADSLAHADDEYVDDTAALPAALANIIGTTHTLELRSQTYYEHSDYEIFTCWKLIPPELVAESAGSATADGDNDVPPKRVSNQLSVPTPSKAREGKIPISEDLEDSDADSLPSGVSRKKKQRISDSE